MASVRNEEVQRGVPTGGSATAGQTASTAAAAAAAAAEKQVQHCLRILQGKSDEHKFAGLLMVAKLNDLPRERLQQVRREVLATVGIKFFVRLLHTRGADADDSLSSFQTLGLNLIASFCSDAAVAALFATAPLTQFVLEQLASTHVAVQSQSDCVTILHGLAATDSGKRLLQSESAIARILDSLETRAQDVEASAADASTATDGSDAPTTAVPTTAMIIAALWSLLDTLARDAAFWHALQDAHVAFVCQSFATTRGGRVALAQLAVLRSCVALVEHQQVAFAPLVPHLDALRDGVVQFLRSKWPFQERDTCLAFVGSLLTLAGPTWLLMPPDATADNVTEPPQPTDSAVSGGKFLLVVLKLVSIEIKLLLDDVELAVVQIDAAPAIEQLDDVERQQRQVTRALHMLPVCFHIVERVISTLVASLGDEEEEDEEEDGETSTSLLLPYDVLLELKQTLGETFAVVFAFLSLAREYMATHRYKALAASSEESIVQLDAVVYASVRVVSAWIAEDPDACMAELVDLAPFLVLYEPRVAASTTTNDDSTVDAVAVASSAVGIAAVADNDDNDDDAQLDDAADDDSDVDSDDEVDAPVGTPVADASVALATQQHVVVDPLHFLLPGLLQLSATGDGAIALTQDAAVLRRLLRFCCTLCASAIDGNSSSYRNDEKDETDVPSLPTLTLALGMLVNLLLEKDEPESSDDRTSRSSNRDHLLHASEWRRALAFLLPLVCANGNIVVQDDEAGVHTADSRGDDDRYVMLLHAVCVVLLVAAQTGVNSISSSSSNKHTPRLAALVGPFNELVTWLVRHPPSIESEAATDLFELVRMLSLRARVTSQTLVV